MKNPIITSIIALCFLGSLASADDFYPLIGYRCYRPFGADSCGINTMLFSYYSGANALFDTAAQLGMKIILAHALKPGFSWNHNITRFSSGQWSAYEAESNSFGHDIGGLVNDPAASDSQAWAVCGTQTGFMQDGPHAVEPYYYWWYDSLVYYAFFKLKTNNSNQSNVLCSLSVWNNDTVLKGSCAVRGIDFPSAGVYYDTLFRVVFKLGKNELCSLDFKIRYMGTNDSLYSDRVDVRDVVADSLYNEKFNYHIREIARCYRDKEPMFRYYMFDEPSPDQFWASGEVNSKLKDVDQTRGGVQALCNREFFDLYLDIANTDELMIDYYPFWGTRCPWGERTPKDSGSLFQGNLDNMCNAIGIARKAAKGHNKEFWFIPQAFGHGYCADSTYQWKPVWNDSIPEEDEGIWREPTPREMRCMVWLALAYGAKGICYFIYQSDKELNQGMHFWICGLTDSLGIQRRPLWDMVKNINQELKGISAKLLSLVSDTVFKASDGIPADCFIKDVLIWGMQDTLIQIGTFHKNNNPDDKYFIIVNRHCLPEESLEVIVELEDTLRNLYDCYSKETITFELSAGLPQPPYFYHLKLQPGQGRIFQLLPEKNSK